jgi:hypothetical protein
MLSVCEEGEEEKDDFDVTSLSIMVGVRNFRLRTVITAVIMVCNPTASSNATTICTLIDNSVVVHTYVVCSFVVSLIVLLFAARNISFP